MNRDRFLQWNHWWQMFTEEDHEAQAVELFLSLSNDTRADLLGWIAIRAREMTDNNCLAHSTLTIQKEVIDDLTRQIRELKGLPPLDRATA